MLPALRIVMACVLASSVSSFQPQGTRGGSESQRLNQQTLKIKTSDGISASEAEIIAQSFAMARVSNEFEIRPRGPANGSWLFAVYTGYLRGSHHDTIQVNMVTGDVTWDSKKSHIEGLSFTNIW